MYIKPSFVTYIDLTISLFKAAILLAVVDFKVSSNIGHIEVKVEQNSGTYMYLGITIFILESNSAITNSLEFAFLSIITGVCYKRFNLCTKMTNLIKKYVRYN